MTRSLRGAQQRSTPGLFIPGIPITFADSPSVITFASPLVGDAQFARTYDAEVPDSRRLSNLVDLVPKVPPTFWGYDHVNQQFPVNSLGKVKLEPACCHHLTTYLFLLSQLGPGGNFPMDPNYLP